jgi:hypothetical protein
VSAQARAPERVVGTPAPAPRTRPGSAAMIVAVLVVTEVAMLPEATLGERLTHVFLPVAVADKLVMATALVVAVLAMGRLRSIRLPLVAGAFPLLVLLSGSAHVVFGSSGYRQLLGQVLILVSGTLCGIVLAGHGARLLARVLLSAGLISAGWALVQLVTRTSFPFEGEALRGFYDASGERVTRSLGFVGEPLALGTIILVAVFASFGTGPSTKRLWVARAILVVGLVTTFSRGSILALVLVMLVHVIWSLRLSPGRRVGVLAAVVGGVCATLVWVPTVAVRVLRVDDSSYSERFKIITAFLPAIEQKIIEPVFGTGADGGTVLRDYFGGGPFDNNYLNLVACWGIVGLVVFFAAPLRAMSLIREHSWISLAVAAVLVSGVTYEFSEYSTSGFLFTVVVAGGQPRTGAGNGSATSRAPCGQGVTDTQARRCG